MLKKIKETAISVFIILAFAAAISESSYFPWSNFAALTILAIIVYVIERKSSRTMS